MARGSVQLIDFLSKHKTEFNSVQLQNATNLMLFYGTKKIKASVAAAVLAALLSGNYTKAEMLCEDNPIYMKTKGASADTARQSNLEPGVAASRKMALEDLKDILKHKDSFIKVGEATQIEPAILAAIASRESRGGRVLRKNGWSLNGQDYGMMQINKQHDPLTTDPFSIQHIAQAAEIFIDHEEEVRELHPDWEEKHIIKGAIAAYNMGSHNVRTIEHMDIGTTNNDYSADVLARAKVYDRIFNNKPLSLEKGQLSHTVSKKQNIKQIAKKYNVSVDRILQANPHIEDIKHIAGLNIVIPASERI